MRPVHLSDENLNDVDKEDLDEFNNSESEYMGRKLSKYPKEDDIFGFETIFEEDEDSKLFDDLDILEEWEEDDL